MEVDQISSHITVTGRHLVVTPAIKDYVIKKIEGLHLAYPKIIEAHIILEVDKYRHVAEVILNCCNHITIEAREISHDLYASIDNVMSKIARRMRKYKTRLLRSHRPRRNNHVQFLESQVIPSDILKMFEQLDRQKAASAKKLQKKSKVDSTPEDVGNVIAQTSVESTSGTLLSEVNEVRVEPYPVKPMFVEEALLQLEVSKDQFLLFINAQTDQLNVIYRHKTGDFGLIQPVLVAHPSTATTAR